MGQYRNQIPEGVQDYLPLECHNKRRVEQLMRGYFFASGYDEVSTPTFEYYDAFDRFGSAPRERSIKFIDPQGRILVLRSDLTTPIARMAATRLAKEQLPLRLFYIGNAFGAKSANAREQKEFTQAGVELLGAKGAQADAEVIALAIEALLASGLKHFQLDIGQVEYFKGLMEEAGLSREQSEELRGYIDEKNALAIELFLHENSLNGRIKERIMLLPTLYGASDVLAKARTLTNNHRALAALDNIEEVYQCLCDFGFSDYITFDLGMLHSIDYYSGIIFRGITNYIGAPILSGGRYDNLVGRFGRDLSATGFAIGIKRVLIALESDDSLETIEAVSTVVSASEGGRAKAYEEIKRLRQSGERVVAAFELSKEALEDYAKTIGAKTLYVEVSK